MSRKKKPQNRTKPKIHTVQQSVRRMDWFDDDDRQMRRRCRICDKYFETPYTVNDIFCPKCKEALRKLIHEIR